MADAKEYRTVWGRTRRASEKPAVSAMATFGLLLNGTVISVTGHAPSCVNSAEPALFLRGFRGFIQGFQHFPRAFYFRKALAVFFVLHYERKLGHYVQMRPDGILRGGNQKEKIDRLFVHRFEIDTVFGPAEGDDHPPGSLGFGVGKSHPVSYPGGHQLFPFQNGGEELPFI